MCYRCLTSVCDLLGLKTALSEIFVEAAVTLSLEAFEAGSIVGELSCDRNWTSNVAVFQAVSKTRSSPRSIKQPHTQIFSDFIRQR